jgi:hypothetical protein
MALINYITQIQFECGTPEIGGCARVRPPVLSLQIK